MHKWVAALAAIIFISIALTGCKRKPDPDDLPLDPTRGRFVSEKTGTVYLTRGFDIIFADQTSYRANCEKDFQEYKKQNPTAKNLASHWGCEIWRKDISFPFSKDKQGKNNLIVNYVIADDWKRPLGKRPEKEKIVHGSIVDVLPERLPK